MAKAQIAGQQVDVPSTRHLRQPSYWPEGPELWDEALVEQVPAALAKEFGNDVAEELMAALAMGLAASVMDASPLDRRSPLQQFERRLRKSVNTFNRQFG